MQVARAETPIAAPTPSTRAANVLAELDLQLPIQEGENSADGEEKAESESDDMPVTVVPDAPSPTRDTVIKTLEARVDTLKKSMWTKIMLER